MFITGHLVGVEFFAVHCSETAFTNRFTQIYFGKFWKRPMNLSAFKSSKFDQNRGSLLRARTLETK